MRLLLDNGIRVLAAVLTAGPLVVACAGPGAPSLDGPSFATGDTPPPLAKIYRLGIGDKLKVAVFGEDNLSGQFDVNASGQLSMPLIGEIEAKGLTLHEVRDAVARRLSDGYLKNPKVSVEMLNYRPIFVQGEVKNGGEYPYKIGLSLRDAVAMAGGYTYRADESYLYIGRNGAPDITVRTPNNIEILPGDNIRIPERFF